MSMELFVSLRYLHGRKMGFVSIITILSIIGVILGTFVLIVALSVANGMEKEVRDRITGTFAHGRVQKFHSKPLHEWDTVRTVIEQHPEVVATSPMIMGKGAIEHRDIQEAVMILAVDDSLEAHVTDVASRIIDGTWSLDSMESARERTLPAIVIGSGMAKKFGVRTGMELVLMSLSSEDGSIDPTPKMMRLVISGVFETGMFEYDQNLIFISVKSGQKMFNFKNSVEGINFRCKNMNDAPQVAKELVEMLGNYPFKYYDWQTQNKSLFQWMALEKLIITFFLSIIVLVAAFNIMATRIMIIMEKRREIGILMSMGSTGFEIMRIFLNNGIVIGLIGTTIGTILAVIFCLAQQTYQFIPLPGDVYFINFLPVLLTTKDIAIVFFGTNALTVLATLYPAISAAKILPAEAVRLD